MLPEEDVRMLVDSNIARWKPIGFIDAWLETDLPFLVMLGFPGCGKTVGCANMIARLGGVYVHTRDLERIFASSFSNRAEQQRIKSARYAAIDDLGTEVNRERFVGALYEVIDLRQSKRTIFTSNLKRKFFDTIYKDSRIQRRLKRAKFVVIKDVDKK